MAAKKQFTDEYEDLLNTIEQENSHSQLNVNNGNRDLVTADENFELSPGVLGYGGDSIS